MGHSLHLLVVSKPIAYPDLGLGRLGYFCPGLASVFLPPKDPTMVPLKTLKQQKVTANAPAISWAGRVKVTDSRTRYMMNSIAQ
ncbi:hypothetical protein SADUNF_Sadunf14G0000300 [Salix dunnii]|uniref:Uncharacterized protein n=1 Tax=Salix dunnii TaxID=1413687 RepID=A0A835MJ43_9ROSI|nr:hypothetical protein SADUNF_Sadunf14G0000300 [Salix dunnii]